MSFIDGFLAAVPVTARDAYLAQARAGWAYFARHGATRMTECWGEDVPEGTRTSFPRAVALEPGEVVVFSWIEWPDRATRDACWAAMDTDPGWAALMGDMRDAPYDMSRMVYGGFAQVLSLP